jgi:hypothetical protein
MKDCPGRQALKGLVILCAVVLVTALGLGPCRASVKGQGPTTWIDRPLDHTTVPEGPLTIQAHASDAGGVARFEFYAGDVLLARVASSGGRFAEASTEWTPPAAGTYTVRARAIDKQGNVGSDATSLVVVGEALVVSATQTPTPAPAQLPSPTATPAAAATPTAAGTPAAPQVTIVVPSPTQPLPSPTAAGKPSPSPRPPTATPRATATPAPAPTATALACPGPPVIGSFTATPAAITAGGSITLTWGAVTNATSVMIEPSVGGVDTPGSAVVTPAATTIYTLTATGCGGTTTMKVTVTVNPAATPTSTMVTADVAVTDLFPDNLPQGVVYVRITNNGPGSLSGRRVWLSCSAVRTETIEGTQTTIEVTPGWITLNLTPGQTASFNTTLSVNTYGYRYRVTCSISPEDFTDPNSDNDTYVEDIP